MTPPKPESSRDLNRESCRDSNRDSHVESQREPHREWADVERNLNSNTPSMVPSRGPLHSPTNTVGSRGNLSSQPGTESESLSDMSVRGLDLLKYAHISSDGSYRCIECEKVQIIKSFKNKCKKFFQKLGTTVKSQFRNESLEISDTI